MSCMSMEYTRGHSFSKPRKSEMEIEALKDQRMKLYEGRRASMPLCVFNLMNAILGSGILGLANAVANLGIALFSVMLVSVAVLAFNSIRLLVELCDYTGNASYEAIGKAAFGVVGKVVTIINIFIHTMGGMCSFLFIVKYELPEVIRVIVEAEPCDTSWYLNGDILTILVTLIIVMPLAATRNIGFLGYTSGFAMACMVFFTAVIVAEYWMVPCPIRDHRTTEEDLFNRTALDAAGGLMNNVTSNVTSEPTMHSSPPSNVKSECGSRTTTMHQEIEKGIAEQSCFAQIVTWNAKSAYAIPTMVFAFQCHASVLPIYNEMHHPTPSRLHKVAIMSIANVFILYSIAALCGYLTFYNAVGSELLLMYTAYNPSSKIILASRIMVLICVIFSTPLLHYPARKSILMLFFEGKPFSWVRHLAIMVILLTAANIFVIYVPTIRDVFGFAGATSASMLVIILPSLFFLRLGPGSLLSYKKIVPLCLVIIGVVFMILSTALIISQYVS